MHIIVHDYAGNPFTIQLSRRLAQQGHHVLHLYAGNNTTPRGLLSRQTGDPDTLKVKGIFIRKPLQKNSFIKRWLQEQEYGMLLEKEIEAFCPEAVISANTPLDAQARAIRISRKIKAKFVFWLQDIIGTASYLILRKKMPGLGHVVGEYYIQLEKKLLRDSDHVVAISDDFVPLLLKMGVAENRISVIQNWAPLESVRPAPKDNPWAQAHGNLQNRFVFLYTGTLGMKHNPAVLSRLAGSFLNNQDVVVYVISETIGAEWLKQQKEAEHLDNLEILNYQPFEVMSDVLASGDVLVAILEADAGRFSVPSKILTYMCSQRPLLLSVPPENLAARLVKENLLGMVIPPGKDEEFAAAAHELHKNAHLRGQYAQNARRYAEQNFKIEEITDQFLKTIR